MVLYQTLYRRGDDGRETDPVRFGDLPENVPVGIAETANDPHRVPVDVVLHQCPLDEVPEILLDWDDGQDLTGLALVVTGIHIHGVTLLNT